MSDSGTRAKYTYDGDGNRVKKSSGKLYWTGGGSDPLQETDLTSTATADYIFFNGKRVARQAFPISNGGFEQGSTNWTLGTGASVVTNSGSAFSGANYLQISTSGGASVVSTTSVPVAVGETISFGGWVYRESGNGYVRWKLEVMDANHTPIAYPGGFNAGSGAWQYQLETYTVPTGASYVTLYCEIYLRQQHPLLVLMKAS